MLWNREQRRKKKRDQLRAKVAKLEQENLALQEKCRILEEENKFCGETLARMRMHAKAELAEAQRKLQHLGIPPGELEKRESDKRNT